MLETSQAESTVSPYWFGRVTCEDLSAAATCRLPCVTATD